MAHLYIYVSMYIKSIYLKRSVAVAFVTHVTLHIVTGFTPDILTQTMRSS